MARIARLSVFLLLVAAGLHMLLGRVVSARVDRTLLELGAGLARLDSGGPRVLELNGARLELGTETVAESVDQLLAAAEADCPGRVLRGGDGGRGYLACAVEEAPFAEGGPPSFRFLYAQPGAEGTVAVSVAADRAIDLERLFPRSGDAPGADAPGLPRPPGSRRILSAREGGTGQQITMYAGDGLEAWYRARLPASGWRRLHGRDDVMVVARGDSLAALVFADREVVVLTSLEEVTQ
jgi:hypothetical protein